MFEGLMARGAAAAARAARRRSETLAGEIADEAPGGVEVAAGPEGVVLSGRGLRRRWMFEPALRWIGAGR